MGGRVLRISTSSALSKKYFVEMVEVQFRLGLDAYARLLLYLEVMIFFTELMKLLVSSRIRNKVSAFSLTCPRN